MFTAIRNKIPINHFITLGVCLLIILEGSRKSIFLSQLSFPSQEASACTLRLWESRKLHNDKVVVPTSLWGMKVHSAAPMQTSSQECRVIRETCGHSPRHGPVGTEANDMDKEMRAMVTVVADKRSQPA